MQQLIRKIPVFALVVFLLTAVAFEGDRVRAGEAYGDGESSETELGAFEITAYQRKLAAENEAGYPVLDAGRGNPNWINTQVRRAFTRFMEFATKECERDFSMGNMAGHAIPEGIGERFENEMDPDDETAAFLISAVDYCEKTLGLDRGSLLKELSDAVIGDYYPSPSRCLPNTEVILNAYLEAALYNGIKPEGETRIFPTEGGSAAMVYIFETLSHNRLLKPGDQIAISTPIFTPYLQIPHVNDYGLVSVEVSENPESRDISEDELKKLEDRSIKAFFLVNPSNPSSHALSQKTIDRLCRVVEKNPDLIILTDDVYGTFAEDFQSLYSVLPHNTILVYSFSKLYGVTGWRTGLIAMNEENVCDRLLSELPEEDKSSLRKEYSIVSTDSEQMPFIERVVADSRSIGLYHTSGLSTPSQVFMDLMSLSHLIYENKAEKDPYIQQANNLLADRYQTLMNALGLEPDEDGRNTRYYALIDLIDISRGLYGGDFADWLRQSRTDIDILDDLAAKKGVVLMYGPGFSAPEGTVRVSLANLNEKDYSEIARRLIELLSEYYEEFQGEAAGTGSAGAKADKYTLEQAVILSRHNLRAPLSSNGSVPSDLTPHEWTKWTAGSSELTIKGGIEETNMGQYFRKWLDKEGLIAENSIPEEGAVRFSARDKQRCIATARYFSAGLFPLADIVVEHPGDLKGTEDFMKPVLSFYSEEYAEDAIAEIEELSEDGIFDKVSGRTKDAVSLIMDTVDMEDSDSYKNGEYGDLLSDPTEIIIKEGEEPDIEGAIKTASQVGDALILQYYEEEDPKKSDFGHELTDEEWQTIGDFMIGYLETRHGTPLLSVNMANSLLKELKKELLNRDRKLTFFCAHDVTVLDTVTALGAKPYRLPDSIEPKTPVGVKLMFERLRDEKDQVWYRVSLVYRSTEQIRNAEILTLDNPPMKYELSFTGVEKNEDGLISEEDLFRLFDNAFNAYDELSALYELKEAA
ncbi:MAG TPA: aspartate 4-decarboxylase [Lachnospiraceae bacterium]|nr:aspartate 4-decarboxylase [Lachnospiraceae bacterium]